MPDAAGLVFSQMSVIEQQTFLSSILNKSVNHYSVIGIDLKGIITTWNQGAQCEYGYSADEIIGKNFTKLYDTECEKNPKIKTILKNALTTELYFAELISIRKNGEYFTAFVNFILRKNNDSPIGFTLISPDLRALQHNLQKCKNEFLANISHELRVPLNTIIGFAQLMYLGKVGAISTNHKEYLHDILLGAERLLRLVNDLLDLNKVESGKMEFFPESICINEMINEIRTIFYNPIKQKEIQLDIKIDPTVNKIIIDPTRFKQILYNYVSNAVKFSSTGGQILICVKPDKNNSFRLEVKDSGTGISKKDLKRLFSHYKQLNGDARKDNQGTGLGLSLTKKIVEAQDGKVGVTSIFGVGSTFYAILPCSPHSKENKKYVREIIKEEIDG
ncbi:MAG: PAS domain-containing sensor histidine kinase [Gammaproteobacteria bacterium]|nr:PAS domain-containing sensor histidine kinase [Gammaproteobacteria bacterium]